MTPSNLEIAYSEAEISRMGEAFRAAWDRVQETDSSLAAFDRQEDTREQLASAVIKYVRLVEASVESLRDAALESLGFLVVNFILPPGAIPDLLARERPSQSGGTLADL
jgi:hypothetical protein